MRILITGASGLLGSYLLKTADNHDDTRGHVFTDAGNFRYLDILSRASIRECLDISRPDVIIHCAGEGRVDAAETNPFTAWRLNLEGVDNLLSLCAQYRSHFVYISSNAVFDGETPPYKEDSPRRSVNEYGSSKIAAEDLVTAYPWFSTIIRPILLYGWPTTGRRGNFVIRLLEDLHAGTHVSTAEDLISQPTYAWDCASAIWTIIKQQKTGKEVFNVAPTEPMSLFKFAGEVAKVFELDASLIQPVQSNQFANLAPRPRDTTFDVSKLEVAGITLPNVQSGLLRMRMEKQ